MEKLYKGNKHSKSNNMPWLTWKESAKVFVKNILNGKINEK